MPVNHWLLKSEPGCYSIDDLASEPDRTTTWSGVRNYQARNFIRDGMAVGDLVVFYHSVTGVAAVGVAEIASEAYPDETAFDPEDEHYDPKSTPEKPLWFVVDVRFVEKFANPVPLAAMRGVTALAGMELLRKGSRLSVMPLTVEEFEVIRRMGGEG